jgi:peptidoglycan/LPS O-acetylase OafA/YrhL
MKQRNTTFDALRGIAALLVLCTHICLAVGGWANVIQYSYFSPGTFGVVLFFCMSGSVIPEAHRRAGSERVYWTRRLLRIVPPYLVGLTLAIITIPSGPPTLPVIFAHLTMLPDLFGITRINSVFWTLEIELLFYMLISAGWRGHPLPWLILAALTGWIAPLGIATIGCGMALRRPTRATMLLAALTTLAWLTLPSDGSIGVRIAAACGLPAYILALRYRGSVPRVLRWLGDISFGVYILHMPIMWSAPPLLWLPLTLVAATVLHVLIERPCMRAAAAAQKISVGTEQDAARHAPGKPSRRGDLEDCTTARQDLHKA